MNNSLSKTYLTAKDVAALLRVSPVTVKQWAQRGLIDAEITPGGHRRFSYEVVSAFAKSHAISLAQTALTPAKVKILIVDDEKPVRTYLQAFFRKHAPGCELETAENGFEAGLKIKSFNPTLVLLDLKMPGMDGFDVCQMISSVPELSGIRVVAMTGYPSKRNLEKILAAGAEKCLKKPLEKAELLALCREDWFTQLTELNHSTNRSQR